MTKSPQLVLLTGTTRSGTTWLQNMLGARPEIVTPQESDLISYYIAPWYEEWRKSIPESAEEWQRRRHNGLPAIITEAEFDQLVSNVIDRVYAKVAGLKPSASIVLDKVPGYAHFGGVALRYRPDARILHLVRDGRDVVSSMRRAASGFGRAWAPSSIDYGAWIWASSVGAARQLRGADCYHELRFEDLRGTEGAAHLHEAFSFCGIDVPAAECSEILERFSLERSGGRPPSSIVWGGEVMERLGEAPDEPSDFFGAGEVGGWHRDFRQYDRWLFDRYAGNTLIDLGYEPDRSWVDVGPAGKAMGHSRFFAERWAGLISSLLAKVKRNLRAQTWSPPSTAIPAPVAEESKSARDAR